MAYDVMAIAKSLSLDIRPLAKVLFARGGKREKVKGEGENTKPFPLSPSPFPDFCKKSIRSFVNQDFFGECGVNRPKLLLWFSILQLSIKKVAAESKTIAIALNNELINNLDLSPASVAIEQLLQDGVASHEQQLRFDINYDLEPGDPRELSEIPEVRLWFVRLDAKYPWLPFLLDWKAGEFARYAAMLVPHQFSSQEGIQYNPEALEIFLMHKIFVLSDWFKQQGIPSLSRLKSMAQMLGYELDDAFFEIF